MGSRPLLSFCPIMEICRGHSSSSSSHLLHLIILYLLIISHSTISPCEGDEGLGKNKGTEYSQKQAPDAAERGIGFFGVNSRWDAFFARLKLAWMNLHSPDSRMSEQRASGASDKLKDASKKSLETMEQTAAAAAQAAEEALGKAKEKLKKSVSTTDGGSNDAEL